MSYREGQFHIKQTPHPPTPWAPTTPCNPIPTNPLDPHHPLAEFCVLYSFGHYSRAGPPSLIEFHLIDKNSGLTHNEHKIAFQ